MFCPNCGTENRDGRRFCRECGSRLDARVRVSDRGVSERRFAFVLEVWRLEAPDPNDAEAQLFFHKQRAEYIDSLVERLGLKVSDWGDTLLDVPREKVWVEGDAPSEAALREVVTQSVDWVRGGQLKYVAIAVGDGPMMPVGVVDPDGLLRNQPDPRDYVRNATNDGAVGAAPATKAEAPPDALRERADIERAARLEAERLAQQEAYQQAERAYREQPPVMSAPPARLPSFDGIRRAPGEVAKRINDIRKRIQGQRAKPPARELDPMARDVRAPRTGGRGAGGRVDDNRMAGDGPVDFGNGDGDAAAREPVTANSGGRGPAGNGNAPVARNGGGGHEAAAPPKPNGGRGQGAKPPDHGAPGQGHKAYGLLRAPAEVVAREEFVLEVGLSKDPAPGVAGPSMNLPAVKVEPYVVNVRIAAAGFDFAKPETQRLDLKVSEAKPYPVRKIRLVAKEPPPEAESVDRTITAEYSIGGERLGDAIRSTRVLKANDQRTRPASERVATGVNIVAPAGTEKADLTITIRRSDKADFYNWTFDTPHTDVAKPNPEPFPKELPDPKEFLRNAINQIDAAEGRKGVFNDVFGVANRVAQNIPDIIWKAIRAIATKRGEPPTILLVSEDPFVPWELAKVHPPLFKDSQLPPFLAAQARVGRWVQATGVDGRTRPSPDPPRRKDVASLGVVSGNYSKTTWKDLAHAREEAAGMVKRYGAVKIKATGEEMDKLLKGDPAADLLHFAVHGRYNPQNPGQESGIILTDNDSLHDDEIATRDLPSTPVVFLNACQVGAGQFQLGIYSGVAAAFVEAGASAVVAPLWKIDDAIAMQIAFDFYAAAARGEPLSEILRRAREPFVDKYETKSATWMAYQLFGHPSFVVGGLKVN